MAGSKAASRALKAVKESGLDSVVLLLAGVVLAILGVLGVTSLKLTLSAATALLSMVGAILLRAESHRSTDRTADDRLNDSVTQLLARLESDPDVSRLLQFEYPDFHTAMAGAKSVDVVAGLALNVVNQYLGSLRSAVKSGARVRLLCPDPASESVVELSIFRSVFRSTPDHVRSDVAQQLEYSSTIQNGAGSVEIRTLPYLPPYGLVRICGQDGSQRIWVKLMAFRVGAGQYPVFSVDSRAPVWFAFFADQIETYFEAGTEYKSP